MTTQAIRALTAPELSVMKLLWRRGSLSAREVHERVGDDLGWAYSTTRTTLERMVRKGIVSKQAFHGLHLFEASISKAAGLAGLVRDFASQVMESNHSAVVNLLAEREVLSDDEIEELRSLLEASQGVDG